MALGSRFALFLFCSTVANYAEAANTLCPAPLSSSYPELSGQRETCEKFREAWVQEYKLKRHPGKLVKDMEGLVSRTEESVNNALCIDEVAKRREPLTESELAELRRMNAQNLQNALRDGVEKGALISEFQDVFKKILADSEKRFRQPDKALRPPILRACLGLLVQKAQRLQSLQGRLPPTPPSKDQPIRQGAKI